MLTLKELKTMSPDNIFASGVVPNSPEGIFANRDGGNLQWLAVRGGIHDWAIYYGRETDTLGGIRDWGDKLHNLATIRKLVLCDDEAFAMYRH